MLQQQQSSINESLTPPGNESITPPGDGDVGGQGGPVVPNLPWWRRGRGIIVISAGISAIATLLLVIIIGSIILAAQTRRPATTYQYQKVTQGNVALTVNMVGPLQGGTYNVVFSGMGKIAEIDVKVGQAVNEGQVLAKLDKTSLEDAVRQAQTGVRIAETTLNNGQVGSNATQGLSGSNIAAAQTALINAQTNLNKVTAQSGASVAAAQTTLNNTQANLSKTQTQSAASVAAAQTTLSNDQTNLSKTQATAQEQIKVAKAQEDQACGPTPLPPPSPNCQVAEAQYNQAVAQANASVAAAQAKVNSDQQSVTSAVATANVNNATAQGQVNTAQSLLNTTQKQTATNNATAQAQVNTAQSQLNVAVSSANLSNTSAQSQVNSAQSLLIAALAQLETAEHNLANATLTAPHDGVITVINGTVGGTPGFPVNGTTSPVISPVGSPFIQIIDTSVLQVQANVGESDAASVRIGEPAQFTVSAYGQRKFGGTVSAISPNAVTVSNVVTFPVTVDVDMNSLRGATLLPGMIANVTIYVVQRSNVLLIPVNAVNFARTAASIRLISPQQAASALDRASLMLQQLQIENPAISMDNPVPAFVLEPSNGQFVVKPVVLGLTDGTNYEVLEGLLPGETIVVGTQSGS